jgi:hypothetical protein
MTFKFTTLLQWFKPGETFIESTLWIEWYQYDSNDFVANCMDILLCNEDQQVKHDYQLDFTLFGKVLGLKG